MQIGDKVGKYELLYPIGEGGMGEVWVGRLRSLGGFESYVAIKVIHGRFAREKRFRDMFLDEARVSAMISHPNVVSTQDVAVEGDMLYQVMEYVDGDALAELQASMAEHNERMPIPVALRIAADVCAGLHAAHELRGPDGRPRGIVHRDVSPQNILVGASGAVKLIDFGVALMQDRLAEDSQGTLKGKLRYMPPEQATGAKVDRRADVYALGAVLYEMVSGYLPFDDRTEAVYFRALIQGDAPAPLPPEIPQDVSEVIARAMATNKEDRYPTAEQMGDDLAAILRKRPANISSFVEIHLSHHAQRRRAAIKQSAADAAGETSPALALEELTEQSAVPAGAPSRPRAPEAPAPAPPEPDLNREISLSLAYPTPGSMELSTADFLTGSHDLATGGSARIDPADVPSLDVPALDVPAPRAPAPAPAPARPRPAAPLELAGPAPGAELQLDGPTPHELDDPTRARTRGHVRPSPVSSAGRPQRFVTGAVGAIPERRREGPSIGRVLAVVGVLVAIVVAGVLAAPAVVKLRVTRAAAARGLDLEIERAKVNFSGIDLERVHATGGGLPLKTGTAEHVHVSFSGNVGIQGLQLSVLGAAKDLPAALDLLGAGSAGTYELDATGVEIEWREPFGKGTILETHDCKFGLAHEEGVAEVRGLKLYSADLTLRAPQGKAGPFTLNIDESESRRRARLVFEPGKLEGPNIFVILGGTTATTHVNARIPRTTLSALRVPAPFVGLPAGVDPTLEVNAGVSFEPDGRVRGEGKAMVAGLAIAGNRAKTPLELDFSLVGSSGKPVEISRGVATYGPITATFSGQFTREPLRGEVRFTSRALPCRSFVAAEARNSLGAAGALAAELFDSVAPVTESVNVKGTFSFDPLELGASKLTFDVRDTCGVALFRP